MTTAYPTAHTGLVRVLAALAYAFAFLAGVVIVTGPAVAALGVSFSGLLLGTIGFALNLRDVIWHRCPDDDRFQSRSVALECAMFVNLAVFLYLGLALIALADLSVT